MNQAKNIISPYIFAQLQDIQIAEVDFDGGWLKNLEVKIP